jgi:hypothetical protein
MIENLVEPTDGMFFLMELDGVNEFGQASFLGDIKE